MLLAGVVVIIRDKDGNELARVDLPDAESVETKVTAGEPGGKVAAALRDGGSAASAASPPRSVGATGDLAPPMKIVEPPALEGWLKGRTVLTVAQDGSGQYKTIQAALDRLKPGEVVEVLDRGPYRKRLRLENPPKDVGLITRCQTVIELAEWKRENSSQWLYGHCFMNARRFRLSGFRLLYERKPKCVAATYWYNPDGAVMEDCAAYPAPGSDKQREHHAIAATWRDDFAAAEPWVVRGCASVGRRATRKLAAALRDGNLRRRPRLRDGVEKWWAGEAQPRLSHPVLRNLLLVNRWRLSCFCSASQGHSSRRDGGV